MFMERSERGGNTGSTEDRGLEIIFNYLKKKFWKKRTKLKRGRLI